LLTTRGPLSGYLGTATREKRSEHGYKIVDAGAPSRAMMKLQLIRSQAYGDPHFNLLIDKIGLTRTNVPLSEITDLLQKVIGGSIAHRYATAIRNLAASYVGPLNFVTHIRLDTDSLGKISGSALNYPIMTQEFMVFTLAGAKLLNVHRGFKCGELEISTEAMEPLPDDALKATKPKFSVATFPKSKLLYTPNLLIARTYDSVVQQIPRGAIAHITSYAESETIQHGAVGFFLELLRDNNKAKVLADTRGIAAIPARLQMDIAEAHALGPMILTRCMAYAIITSFLRDAFRTMHLHPERWDEGLFLAHNIQTCVRACANYWKHPLFFGHPDSDKFRASPMRYAGWMSSDRVIAAQVRSQLVRIMSTIDHKFWRLPVPVFSGSDSMGPVEAVTIAGAKVLYPLYIEGSSYAREYGNLFSSFSRIPVKRPLTPDEQLSLLRARMVKLSSIYSKHGDIMIADRIRDLGHMKGVLVFNDDFRTVLRYARTLIVGVGTVREQKPLVFKMPPQAIDHCWNCRPVSKTKLQIMWQRYSKRLRGGLTSSGYTWLPVLSDMHIYKSVTIVGAGNGGLADLLISAYGCEVLGIDLEKDLPSDSATLLNYYPTGLKHENAPKFTESDLCLTTTGDWLDKEVREKFLDALYTKTTLFVDITSSVTDLYLNLITDSLANRYIDYIYMRLIGPTDELKSLQVSLRDLDYSVKCWFVSTGMHEDEMIWEVTKMEKHLHRCKDGLPLYMLDIEQFSEIIPSKYGETILAASCSSLSWEGETVPEYKTRLRVLCKSLLDKPKSRQLLYRDRLALIYGYSTYYAALSDNPVQLIQSWIADEEVSTDLFRISTREDLITHLMRYVSRVRGLVPVVAELQK